MTKNRIELMTDAEFTAYMKSITDGARQAGEHLATAIADATEAMGRFAAAWHKARRHSGGESPVFHKRRIAPKPE